MKGKLTDKQKKFVDEYLICLNATEAAIRAGYSKKTAGSVGHENLKKPEIEKAIAEKQKKLQEKTEITTERVLDEYAKLAFSQLPGIANYSGGYMSLEDFENLTDAQRACIKDFECTTEKQIDPSGEVVPVSKVKVKLHDKMKALDSIARHLGLFNGKVGAEGEGATQTIYNFIIKGKDEQKSS